MWQILRMKFRHSFLVFIIIALLITVTPLIKVSSSAEKQNEVKLIKIGAVYEVPVVLNNVLTINFILDSGASDVSISPDVALTLIRTKTIEHNDWLPGAYYKFADGTEAKSKRFKLKSVKIGNKELKNVTCSISNSFDAPMLLGQSALQKLGTYSIDYGKMVIIFNAPVKSSNNYNPKIVKSDGRFIAYEDGTVLDTKINLMWLAKDTGRGEDWEIFEYINLDDLYTGGYENWRLPTLDELVGLYDIGQSQQKEYTGIFDDQAWKEVENRHLSKLINIYSCCIWASDTRIGMKSFFNFCDGEKHWISKKPSVSPRSPSVLLVRDTQ